MPSLHKPRRCLHQMLIIYGLIFVSSATTPDQMPLPDLCDSVKCPPDAEMHCPADSAVRQNLIAVELIKSNAVELPTDPGIADKDATVVSVAVAYNSSSISERDFEQCCLPRKCVCKTCYIPDCDAGKVVVELEPENMQSPGHCCGTYECRAEPNCTEVLDTEFQWLKECQRCRCNSGFPFCHQDCDERAEGGVCESKIPNMFYKDGDTWTDGCQQCECVKGESKCAMSFCGNLNCPSERHVMLKDTCCPVCWPKCAPMPHDDGYRDYTDEESQEELDQEQDSLPPLLPEPQTTTTTQKKAELIASTSTSTSTSTTTTTAAPLGPITICQSAFDQTDYFSYWLLGYAVIATIAIFVQGGYIYLQRAKKRSYDPVSILDHSI